MGEETIVREEWIVQFTPGVEMKEALKFASTDLKTQFGARFIAADLARFPYSGIPLHLAEVSNPYFDTYILVAYLWQEPSVVS